MENIIPDKKDFKTLKKLCAITYIETNRFKEVFDMDAIYNITKERINNGYTGYQRIDTITIIDIFRKYDISYISYNDDHLKVIYQLHFLICFYFEFFYFFQNFNNCFFIYKTQFIFRF